MNNNFLTNINKFTLGSIRYKVVLTKSFFKYIRFLNFVFDITDIL
jgi:hypothetical protein